MQKSKDLFMLTRLEEMAYDGNFSKKDCQNKGTELAKSIVDRGEVQPYQALSNVVRLNELLKNLETELRKHVEIEGKELQWNGVTFTERNTGDRLEYANDEVYSNLQKKLKQREDILKTAYKSDEAIYDSEGVEVPKVGIKTHGKITLNVKF